MLMGQLNARIYSLCMFTTIIGGPTEPTNAMTVDLTCDPVALSLEYQWVDVAAEDILSTAA